jgi:hypothetical protein
MASRSRRTTSFRSMATSLLSCPSEARSRLVIPLSITCSTPGGNLNAARNLLKKERYTARGRAKVTNLGTLGPLVNQSLSSAIACPAFGARLQFL